MYNLSFGRWGIWAPELSDSFKVKCWLKLRLEVMLTLGSADSWIITVLSPDCLNILMLTVHPEFGHAIHEMLFTVPSLIGVFTRSEKYTWNVFLNGHCHYQAV